MAFHTHLLIIGFLFFFYVYTATQAWTPHQFHRKDVPRRSRRRRNNVNRPPSKSFSISAHPPHTIIHNKEEQWKGTLVLWTVPVAWGTFEVAVRYVYATLPQLPTLLFSASYYAVATLALLAVLWLQQQFMYNDDHDDSNDSLIGETTEPNTKVRSIHNDAALRGGLELGTYLFLGNYLQLIALQTVSANRAAFLLQLTTVLVPLFQGSVTGPVWRACGLALLGVALMSVDASSLLAQLAEGDTQAAEPMFFAWSLGDTCVVGAAVAYTGHCLRLERYAQQVPNPVLLGAAKGATEWIWTLLLLGAALSISSSSSSMDMTTTEESSSWLVTTGRACGDFLQATTVPPVMALAAILWTGCVPIAYTIVAQSYGQRRVRPVPANLIYTIQPLATAVFAFLLLHEETLQWNGYLGGALIGLAVLLVVQEEEPDRAIP